MFVRVWEFGPRPASADRFVEVYGPAGDWAALFGEAPGYLGTVLVQAATDARRYRTLDFWREAGDWSAFLAGWSDRYGELDRACGGLVEAEREVAVLRRAIAGDASAMADLAGELGYPNTAGEVGRRLEVVSAAPDELVLVAETAGVVRGWLHVFGARRLESEPYAEVGGLIVSEAARNDGLGHALLVSGERWAAAHGFGEMRVRSNVRRDRAHRFYQRNGYASPRSQRVFVKALGAIRHEG